MLLWAKSFLLLGRNQAVSLQSQTCMYFFIHSTQIYTLSTPVFVAHLELIIFFAGTSAATISAAASTSGITSLIYRSYSFTLATRVYVVQMRMFFAFSCALWKTQRAYCEFFLLFFRFQIIFFPLLK